jgi:hypothetical protein
MSPTACLLQGFKTLLTDSQDASFLFNAVLDAVVDHTMPVVQVRSRFWVCILCIAITDTGASHCMLRRQLKTMISVC